MLGLYVSDHPLMGIETALRRKVECSIADLAERDEGSMVTIGGVITNLARKYTKRGDLMATFVLEDLQDSVEVTVFPRMMTEQGHKLADDVVVTVRGRVDKRDDTVTFNASEVTIVEGLDATAPPLHIRMPMHSITEFRMAQLKKILRDHPGDSRVILHVGENKVAHLPDEFSVNLDRVVGELRVVFGHDAVVL
jgi:DNA polymerase-3 subunit alpha